MIAPLQAAGIIIVIEFIWAIVMVVRLWSQSARMEALRKVIRERGDQLDRQADRLAAYAAIVRENERVIDLLKQCIPGESA